MKLAFYRSSAPGAQPLDKAINLLSGRGGFSHVELQFADGVCFSSSPRDGGCRFKTIDTSDPATWALVEVPPPFASESEVREACTRKFCQSQNGKPYDWSGCVGVVIPLRALDHPYRRWFCSEVVTRALQRAGMFMNLSMVRTSPNGLYRAATV